MTNSSKPVEKIRKLALDLPDVTEGTSCNNAAFKVNGKSFLFLGCKEKTYDLRFKLADSLDEAATFAEQQPEHYSIGLHGWTHVVLPHTKSMPAAQLKRWVAESYRLFAPKNSIEKSPAKSRSAKLPQAAKQKTAKRTSATKKSGKKSSRG